MMADSVHDIDRLNAALDRYGSDFDAWPDRETARWARELVLASPEARAAFDEARALERMLDAREAAFTDDALAARISAGMTSAPHTGDSRRWIARLAACFLVAALFGSAFEQIVPTGSGQDEAELAMLDSFLYGPEETELP